MDPTFWSGFWGNVGHLWWLIFPIMGVAGGIGRRWQIASRERHERRLETLRLKSELKTAELQARGIPVASGGKRVGARPAAQPASVPPNELLERLFAEHDEITARWLDYELDVAKLIAFPAMSDGRQPLTAAFLRAKKTADALRPASADAKVTEQRVTEYLDAVGNYAVAFEVAERDARRLRDSSFSADERKRLDRAQHMLKVALDESATQAERQVAYKRVRDELEGLIVLSDDAVDVLEKKVAGELPRAQNPSTPPTPEPERLPLKRDEPLA
ncbi:hypothetical protein [Microbacterium suwonense]|uniref:Uncharacterized protein n=1 Tax=Microbacterium suwonense TaxID=683047 RepID=A0ABN6X572_9MICO|nr:hypothetical protein [Microbacterium suwonense]BDZ39816.1 hypothetical protein GCM10025863_24300 [Microbacterium suwonense]